MAEHNPKCKKLSKSSSVESNEPGSPVAKSIRERKVKKPKERWLLTRKTWRYMADAGRKLIPDGSQNRIEDIPKIEAHFQEICKKEARFLLWRKNSYPGALGFRSKKRKDRRKSNAYRKTYSVDEIDDIKLERPKDLHIPGLVESNFDVASIKKDKLPSPSSYSLFAETPTKSGDKKGICDSECEEPDEKLISMLEDYLTLEEREKSQTASSSRQHFNYMELVEKLQQHLKLVSSNYTAFSNYPSRKDEVHFEGDHVQKSLSETLSRYFSQYSNRDRIISDLLTDRKSLEKLYFDLRKSRGFRGRRVGSDYTSSPSGTTQWRSNLRHRNDPYNHQKHWESSSNIPTPLIEVQNESTEVTYHNWGTQTTPIPEGVLNKIGEEYRRALAEREEEERVERKQNHRRRSSVDHDDVSQSVSDTIKRYLRMARKKSVDSDKADRFKRVNYDRNLRNIKAKGEITKPGDDDGLNKGCQTSDDWILTYRDLKFDEIDETREFDSCVTSSRSSIDVGVLDDSNKSLPSSPPSLKQSHSFLSNLLHGKQHDKSNPPAVAAGAMQKSKSSSSVIHHGSRLMAKKIFRSRSKSQTRPPAQHSSWTPQGGCVWTNVSGREVALCDTSLLHLSEVERKVLQKVSLAKLQALNLGVSVKIPTETVGVPTKPKKRPYLLKRKAATTSIFDTNRKDVEKDKDGNITGGLVFGIPLTQCIENDRLSKVASDTSPFRSGELPQEDHPTIGRHGSRTSFSSLIDASRGNDSGSCENLTRERHMGSVPGLLDAISCSSTTDIASTAVTEEEFAIPNILNVCFRHLETYGLHTLGIFRVSTSKKRIRQLREDFDSGKETALDEEQCPHDVATLLKEYLRDLPDPLLCRDLYHAFVQTQRIRNRRLQFEALQHLIQLLPPANRNTLWALLGFLANVAKHATDSKDNTGEAISGNKMDSNNLATVFAPNILHCIKPNAKESSGERPEDRIDIINVVRMLIDNFQQLFKVPAELLDEVYVHMMDSHPEELDQLLNKRDGISITIDESVDDMDSESNSAPWTPTQPTSDMDHILQSVQAEANARNNSPEPKKTYSREECLHEAAATGGPNVTMRIRHKDRIRDRSTKKRRDDSLSQRTRDEDSDRSSGSSISSAMTIISRLRGQKDENHYRKLRSSSIESNSSIQAENDFTRVMCVSEDISQGNDRRKSSPYVLGKSGVITASLTIPVQTTNQTLSPNLEEDIPYIEDGSGYNYDSGKQQMTIGIVKRPSVPPRRRQRSISGSDSSNASNAQTITGSISLLQQSCDSALGSSATFSIPLQNTPPSISSSIADAGACSSPTSWASTPPTSPDSTNSSVNYIPDDTHQISALKSSSKSKATSTATKDLPVLQKVSFTSTSEMQQVKQLKQEVKQQQQQHKLIATAEIQKSPSTPAFNANNAHKGQEREQKFTPSITSIGNAVLRSRTADFERIAKTEEKTTTKTITKTTVSTEKKKYTKRRYTDSRHQTRHIPDSETLEAASSSQSKKEVTSASHSGPVYKRRELISSVPTK